MSIYDRIQQLAKDHAMSIRQLEQKLGFGNGTLKRWERNMPSVDKVEKVANLFDVSVDYLLGRENKNENNSEYYFSIQRKSKKLSMNEQKKLLQLMELTFDDLDDEDEEDDDL